MAGVDTTSGVTAVTHVGSPPAPSCMTPTVCPAIVSAPNRDSWRSLPAAVNLTVPGPLPDPPSVIVTKSLALVAAQGHHAGAETYTDPVVIPGERGSLSDTV